MKMLSREQAIYHDKLMSKWDREFDSELSSGMGADRVFNHFNKFFDTNFCTASELDSYFAQIDEDDPERVIKYLEDFVEEFDL